MEKRSISFVLLFVFLIFLLEFVSSATCSVKTSCNEDNLVMKLYSNINSHGALYNEQVAYNYYLCCDFTGTHTCDESKPNIVLILSAPYNAHAQGPSKSTYTHSVCFGNLTCTSTTGSCNNDFPIPMVSLSAETNAHIAEFDYSYPYKICCAFATSEVRCGNGKINEGEKCDDGNNANGDGCSYPGCTIERPDWECRTESGESSDYYLINPETKWRKNGAVPRRGSGIVEQRNQ